ncbi:aquaporin AQPAe.a-like isoform X1 [Macrosteles quadrilineatus]|uniref:aquaporin AQPAe.a-like isoform X1 n=2 Tax=Macrosteles quadrilineatus TaxID=74068 RepID=UPI0023E21E3C|nr:aquaporin AQPAe.a-like isoform X1 [Macrosteles quadrilineatus]
MPGYPRPPSLTSYSQTELGAFKPFLEKPRSLHNKHVRVKMRKRREMPSHRQVSDHHHRWRHLFWKILEVFLAETVGTGMLLFFGCMGQVNFVPEVEQHPLQGAVVFAVVVATIIQIFGHISNAHLNPAVTIAFLMLGQVTAPMALVYVLSEVAGAVLGYGLLMLLTPPDVLTSASPNLCCTLPHSGLTDVQAVAMEFFATCFLVMVVCACADPRNQDKSDSVPLKFGCTILALSIAVGPYTGASMNPARSMGPALFTGNWTSHWVYWVGPCLSGFFTAIFYQAIFNRPQDPNLLYEVEPLNMVKVNDPSSSKREREEKR